jgi:hypothetical protein
VISEKGVSTCLGKIEVVAQWLVPVCVKDLRSILGLTGYYRKFVKHFGIISRPLTNLLKKNAVFQWNSDHDVAFNTLKSALVHARVLSLPDFSKKFYIETDALEVGVGAVLMQENRPLAFVTKALGPKMRGLSTYEKEYVAILLAVEHWRSYLQYNEFIIVTDQRSMPYLNEQRLHTVWQQKYLLSCWGWTIRLFIRNVWIIRWLMLCLGTLFILLWIVLVVPYQLLGPSGWKTL